MDLKDTTRIIGIEQDPKDRIELKGYIDQNPCRILRKLPNTTTTILRNTVASKAAIGPLTTSNSKTGTNLNPQVELIATNTEIKQL